MELLQDGPTFLETLLMFEAPPCGRRVAMIGGGYIACEQASIYNNFGAEVHLLVRGVRPWSTQLSHTRSGKGCMEQHLSALLASGTSWR